jgi:coenzyme F420-reducing hydrogenase gamma subunit
MKVAFFDFAGCEGDQLQIANLEEDLLVLLDLVEVVSFREIMKEHSDDYDIAFIEGSCTRPEDEERLHHIRNHAKKVVALGSCATIGGINSMRNHMPVDVVKKGVYGEHAASISSYNAWPIDAVIPVDVYVHGCPIDRREFVHVVTSLVTGKNPDIPNYPVCVECKKNENVCSFERGEFCVGPVTRAGCNSCCINEGTICWGCRGLVDNPNEDAHKEVLEKYGLTATEVANKFRLYFGWEGD